MSHNQGSLANEYGQVKSKILCTPISGNEFDFPVRFSSKRSLMNNPDMSDVYILKFSSEDGGYPIENVWKSEYDASTTKKLKYGADVKTKIPTRKICKFIEKCKFAKHALQNMEQEKHFIKKSLKP